MYNSFKNNYGERMKYCAEGAGGYDDNAVLGQKSDSAFVLQSTYRGRRMDRQRRGRTGTR